MVSRTKGEIVGGNFCPQGNGKEVFGNRKKYGGAGGGEKWAPLSRGGEDIPGNSGEGNLVRRKVTGKKLRKKKSAEKVSAG